MTPFRFVICETLVKRHHRRIREALKLLLLIGELFCVISDVVYCSKTFYRRTRREGHAVLLLHSEAVISCHSDPLF